MKYELNRVGKWKLKIVKSLICASVKIHIFVKFKNPNPIKMGPPLRIFHLLMQRLTPLAWTKYLLASCHVFFKQDDNRNYYYCGVLIKNVWFFFCAIEPERWSQQLPQNWEFSEEVMRKCIISRVPRSLLGIGKVWIWRINFRESV